MRTTDSWAAFEKDLRKVERRLSKVRKALGGTFRPPLGRPGRRYMITPKNEPGEIYGAAAAQIYRLKAHAIENAARMERRTQTEWLVIPA